MTSRETIRFQDGRCRVLNGCGAFTLVGARSWLDLLNWPLYSWVGFLFAAIGLVVLVWWVVRLVARVNEDTDPAEADREMLLALSELHQEGDLTPEEYRSIKSQLMGRLRAKDHHFSASQNAAKSAGTVRLPQKSSQPTEAESEAGDEDVGKTD